MLLHQLGQDLILLDELLFELLDLAVSSIGLGLAGPLQRRGTVLEKQLLPVVEDGRIQAQLVTQIGDRCPLDQMPLQDGNLLLRSVVVSRLSHGKSSFESLC